MAEALRIKVSHYVLGGVAIVSAIAWNSAVRSAVEHYFPAPEDAVVASVTYAIIITLFLILLIYTLPDTSSELPRKVRKQLREVTPPQTTTVPITTKTERLLEMREAGANQ